MGELITLAEHRLRRRAQPRPPQHTAPPVFYFDLGCPYSYLALERVDRLLPGAHWRPTPTDNLHPTHPWTDTPTRTTAEHRARELGLPLIWPTTTPHSPRPAMRAALHAINHGPGPQFALAAARLAFCGGYDLNDPAIIAEAAAAANLDPHPALHAAHNPQLDQTLENNAQHLLAAGATCLPAIRIGPTLHCGETTITQAAAAQRKTPQPGAGAA
jgi:2-hydroxychromene-2-carboxylate isomerase